MASKDSIESLSISEANNHLAIHLYKLLMTEQTNMFFSPFSVSVALAMLLCGSANETAVKMKEVLGYDPAKIQVQDIKLSFQRLLNALKSNEDDYTLSCANLILCQKEFTIKDEFKSILEESFEALWQEVDFRNESQRAVQLVNSWVQEKTKNMIPKFIDSLDESTAVVLLNAIYFKGFWLNKFDKSDTLPKTFYNQGTECNAKTVEMMYMEGKFPFLEKESFKALQLPYMGEDISMLILLPNSINGLEEMEAPLSTTAFDDLLKEMWENDVQVSLPKFRLEYSKSLKEPFQSMGLSRLFSTEADFGGISDSKGLFISEIVHKAVVEVNEEGSEAAAVTGPVTVLCALPRDAEFIIDHPFLFVIYDSENKLFLFMGRVYEL